MSVLSLKVKETALADSSKRGNVLEATEKLTESTGKLDPELRASSAQDRNSSTVRCLRGE